MLGFNKPKKLIADLDRVHFFGLEEPEQLEVLDQVNSYTTSRSKLNKLVDAGLLSKLANLLAGVQSAKMLPIPQHKLMELLTQFAKLEEIIGSRYNRQALVIGCGLVLFQQLSGQPSVLYFANRIFENAGLGFEAAGSQHMYISLLFIHFI